jgi:hypothetical protein
MLNLALAIMFIIAIVNLILGVSGFYSSITVTGETQILVNGSVSTVTPTVNNFALSFDLSAGIFAILGIATATALAFGTTVVNSGFKNHAVQVVVTVTLYLAIWSLLSASAYTFITSIPIIGLVLYGVLTVIYVMGVIKKVTTLGGDGDE